MCCSAECSLRSPLGCQLTLVTMQVQKQQSHSCSCRQTPGRYVSVSSTADCCPRLTPPDCQSVQSYFRNSALPAFQRALTLRMLLRFDSATDDLSLLSQPIFRPFSVLKLSVRPRVRTHLPVCSSPTCCGSQTVFLRFNLSRDNL